MWATIREGIDPLAFFPISEIDRWVNFRDQPGLSMCLSEVDGKFCTIKMEWKNEGELFRLHHHPWDEKVHVREGLLIFEIEGRVKKVFPGQTLIIPAYALHTCTNGSEFTRVVGYYPIEAIQEPETA